MRRTTDAELTELQRSVIMGVHKRDYRNGSLAAGPSKIDFETLNAAYLALCKFEVYLHAGKNVIFQDHA